MANTDSSIISTEAEYYAAINNIKKLDTLIDQSYSYLDRIPTYDTEKTLKVQNLIESAKKLRLGNWNLTKIYESSHQETVNNKRTYIVKIGDTLPYVAYKFYNRTDLWQYIYHENGLQTDDIQPNDELIIPILSEPIDPIINGAAMFAAEWSKIYAEKVLHDE